MPNEGQVYFGLSGDFDREELTRFIGLNPTSAWNRGEKDTVRDIPRCSRWDYSSTEVVDEIVDVYALSEWVVERLEPFEERIKDAIEKWRLSAVLQVVLKISIDDRFSTPAIGFSSRVIRFVASVGAGIDVDTYRTDLADGERAVGEEGA